MERNKENLHFLVHIRMYVSENILARKTNFFVNEHFLNATITIFFKQEIWLDFLFPQNTIEFDVIKGKLNYNR